MTAKTDKPHSGKQRRSLRQGLLFIISAPSGAGKTTLCEALCSKYPDLLYSVSYTTRKPRGGERDGIDYHFIQPNDFKERIRQNRWAEWAEVHGNFYGTSLDFIETGLAAGRDILLAIDVQGASKILLRYPESITIFIMPPDMDTLRRRLISRGTESEEEITKRLINAKQEIACRDRYRHVIINDCLSRAQNELDNLIRLYRAKRSERNV